MNPSKDYSPLEVRVPDRLADDPEALGRALGRFKRMVANEKIMKDWKRKQVYEKPSEKRRRKEREGAGRRRKDARKREQLGS